MAALAATNMACPVVLVAAICSPLHANPIDGPDPNTTDPEIIIPATSALLEQSGLLGLPFTCHSIDIDGDGQLDEISVRPSDLGEHGGSVSIKTSAHPGTGMTIGSPRGEFAFARRIAVVDDVNTDGWRDIAIASARYSSLSGWHMLVRIYSSRSAQLLGLLDRPMTRGSDPSQIALELDFNGGFEVAADVNRDARLDVEDVFQVASSIGTTADDAPALDLDASGEVSGDDVLQAALSLSTTPAANTTAQIAASMNDVTSHAEVAPDNGTAHHYSTFRCWLIGARIALEAAALLLEIGACAAGAATPGLQYACAVGLVCTFSNWLSAVADFLVHCNIHNSDDDYRWVATFDEINGIVGEVTSICSLLMGGGAALLSWKNWKRTLENFASLGSP